MPTDAPNRPEIPIIRSERIYLRPAERGDLPLFVRWLGDAEVSRHLMVRAPLSLAMEEKWFERLVDRQGTTDYHFVVCLLAADHPIGTVGLHRIDLENGSAEFGIALGEKDEWDHGYGTEALLAIADFGFGALRLERLSLHVDAPNRRARRSYEKAGFVEEGSLRHAHFVEGAYVDVVVMSQLRDEWLAHDHRRAWELLD